jgi:tetratricopeptide (TPR) repeat protein
MRASVGRPKVGRGEGTRGRREAAARTDGGDCFVGRDAEREALLALIAEHPVVVVCGAAGVGKTTLVSRVVDEEHARDRLPPPAYVSLAGVERAETLVERTAQALGATARAGCADAVEPTLRAILERQPCTLVWDDLHASAAALVTPLLRKLSKRRVEGRLLVLSRERLIAPLGPELPFLEVPPFDVDTCTRLVEELDQRTGRRLYGEIAARARGNPLLVRLALASLASGGWSDEPLAALRATLATLTQGAAREPLARLVAAGAPLDENELAGSGPRTGIDLLRRHLVVTKVGSQLALAPYVEPIARAIIGEPPPAVWQAVVELATRRLAAGIGAPEALAMAARAHTRLGDGTAALALLRAQRAARAGLPLSTLRELVRELLAATPTATGEAMLLVAREELRRGSAPAALATVDDLLSRAPPTATLERARIVRAEALMAAGELETARGELELARATVAASSDEAAVIAVALAQLDVCTGDLAGGRAQLRALARRTASTPRLEARRALALALGHLLEQQYDGALAAARASRRAFLLHPFPEIPALLDLVELQALLGLDQIDRADAFAHVVDRDAGGAPSLVLRALVAYRRGELVECARLAGEALAASGAASTLRGRTYVACAFAHACLGMGQLGRAEEILRAADAHLLESGLRTSATQCDLTFMLLEAMRGDWGEARRRVQRARRRAPESPIVAAEASWAGDAPAVEAGPPSLLALAALRRSEQALAHGRPAEADGAARDAERWYRRVGAAYDRALALLARGEALADLGQTAKAQKILDTCEALAAAQSYNVIRVAARLIRAAIADRTGDLPGYVRAIAAARDVATRDLWSPALARACARVGLEPRAQPFADGQPMRDRVARLRLGRAATRLCRVDDEVYLLADDEAPRGHVDVVGHLDTGRIVADGGERVLPHLGVQLFGALADSGSAGCSLEDLYLHCWGGTEYHSLRHRNSLYVALTRLRSALKPIVGRDLIVKLGDGNYALAPTLRVAVCRAVEARGAGLSRAQTCWQQALAAAPPPVAAGDDDPASAELVHRAWQLGRGQ